MKPLRPSSYNAILEAAFIVFNRDPSASLSEVAELAGVGRATLHRHFASRETLLHSLAMLALKEMDEAVEKACVDVLSYSEATKKALEVLIPLGDRHGFLASGSFDLTDELKAEIKRQNQESIDMVEGAKKEGLFDPSIPTSWIVKSFDYLIYAAWESVKADEITRSQATHLAWKTLTQGLGRETQ